MEELVVVHLEEQLFLEELGCMGIGMAGKESMACCKNENGSWFLFQVELNYHGWQICWHPQLPLAGEGIPPIPGIIPPIPGIIPPIPGIIPPIPGIIPIPGNCPSTAVATPSFDSSELTRRIGSAMAAAKRLNKTIPAAKKQHYMLKQSLDSWFSRTFHFEVDSLMSSTKHWMIENFHQLL
jgi:hypothetical protein